MKKITFCFALILFAIPAVTHAQTVITTPPVTNEQAFTPAVAGNSSFINALLPLECSSVASSWVFTPLVSVFTCSTSGRFPNPDNCHDYIFCVRRPDGTYMRRDYSCAAGSAFDVNSKICVPEAAASNPYPPCNN